MNDRKQYSEKTARIVDQDFSNNLDAYLAMYRPKPEVAPLSTKVLRLTELILWTVAITIWANLLIYVGMSYG